VERVSEALLTFLVNAAGQVLAVTAAAAFGSWLMRRAPARYRHVLWLIALALCLVLPLYTVYPEAAAPALAPALGRRLLIPMWFAGPLATLVGLTVLWRGVRCARAWFATRRVRRAARPAELAPQAATAVDRCRHAFQLGSVPILAAEELSGPVTCGTRKPVIVAPPELLDREPETVVAAMIGHEMAHIRRRDYGINLVCELLLIPLAWHPAALYVKRRIDETREVACDEMVASLVVEAPVYARSLVRVAELAAARLAPGYSLGVTDGGSLKDRVHRLVSGHVLLASRAARLRLAVGLAALVAVAAGASLSAVQPALDQPPPPPVALRPPPPPPPPPPPARR